MALTPMVFERFGGLRIAGDPGEVGLEAATDMLNVDLAPDRSRVFTRSGVVALNTSLRNPPGALCPVVISAIDYMMCTGKASTGSVFLDRIASNGVRVAVGTWIAAFAGDMPPKILPFGTPTQTFVFIAWSTLQLRKYDGTTLATSVGYPGHIEVAAQSNRMVQAWFSGPTESPTGANGTKSTVFFSDPGLPETFSANNYVHLHPGDGEEITGMVAWRELLFVFKESRAFVFYGESTDSTGQPVFNYRQITLASTVDRSSPAFAGQVRVVAGGQGVYFIATDGVYRTTGGQPQKVSAALDGLDLSGGVYNLSVAGDRVAFATDTNGSHYVMDERNGEWTRWLFSVNPSMLGPIVAWPHAFPSGRPFVFASNTTLYRSSLSVTTDAGIDFQSRYRSGVSDLGSPAEKTVREILVDGSGVVNVGVGVNWGANPAGVSVTLGTAPAVAQGRMRNAFRGRNFRVQFDATSGAWSVNRFGLMVRSQRPAGVTST